MSENELPTTSNEMGDPRNRVQPRDGLVHVMREILLEHGDTAARTALTAAAQNMPEVSNKDEAQSYLFGLVTNWDSPKV